MTDRRRFLTTGLTAVAAGIGSAGFGHRASAAILPLFPAAPAAALPAALASPVPAALARARALSPGFHMLDGWILTDRDLEELAYAV